MSTCAILSYGCSSSAGSSTEAFWKGLCDGVDHSRVEEGFSSRVCVWPQTDAKPATVLELLTRHLVLSWQECLDKLEESKREALLGSGRLGVILASTKGCIDDWVWDSSSPRDPLTPVLESFLEKARLNVTESICVSNACASSLAALLLGKEWLSQGRVDHVLILAADHAGPFVRKGFEVLKAVTPTRCRPFSQDRDGLCLGEAAAAILLGREAGIAVVEAVATDTEGYAVTRPAQSGTSLKRACLLLDSWQENAPDLILAHGTATSINDRTEDQVFATLFGEKRVPVTATKWSVGHTLAASAAMDLIAAVEVLKRQKVFSIANTTKVDPDFKSSYLIGTAGAQPPRALKSVLVTSLGFGGVHAAAWIKA